MVRFDRHDAALAVLAYAAALVARLTLLDVHPYGDEAHHYYIAREFGATPANLVGGGDLHWLFWWRPLFSLLLSPGAQLSFEGFRLGYILLTASLAPLAYLLVRSRGLHIWAASFGALLVGLHPFLVLWGVRAFPDELMAVFYVLGLLLWQQQRFLGAGAALLAASWVKEVALVGAGLLLLGHLWQTRSGWRPRLTRGAIVLAIVLALAYVPHLYAESIGGRPPGWTRGGDLVGVLDGAFLSIWFLPLVALAVASRPARRLALHALGYLTFFAAYHVVLGGAAEQWYFVLPATLAFLALAAALGDWVPRALAWGRSGAYAAAAPVAVVLVLLATQVLAPTASQSKQDLHVPGWEGLDFSAQELWAYERQRDDGLWQAIDALTPADRQALLLVDVAWFYGVWPFPDITGAVGSGFTVDNPAPSADWATVVEEHASATLVFHHDSPLNHALRKAYAPCISFSNADYTIIQGRRCPGQADELDAWHRMA